ncbi:MAG: flagellar hook assembly protein FlgD [Desulfohalobiaceae bacterium]
MMGGMMQGMESSTQQSPFSQAQGKTQQQGAQGMESSKQQSPSSQAQGKTQQQGVQGMDHLLGQAEEEFAEEPGGSSELDRDSFLKILLTQLETQDPTDPMKDRDFVAQLAQFSSLEQLINLNDGMENMQETKLQDRMLGALSFVGKDVRAEGGQIQKDDSGTSTVTYELQEPAQEVTFDIYDQEGNIVASVNEGAQAEGEASFQWDGTNYQGQEVQDGLYTVEPRAEGKDGQSLEVATDVSGRVDGVQMEEESIVLTLADGRQVQLSQVKEMMSPGQQEEE